MSARRGPFVWEVQVRQEVLDEELTHLRELPYSLWREMLDREMIKSATGRDNRTYKVKVTAEWASRESEDIRVTVSLESSGLRRNATRKGFVITPDNTFAE